MKIFISILFLLLGFSSTAQLLAVVKENDTAKIFDPHTGTKSAIVTSSPATFSIGTVNSTAPLTIANTNATPPAPQAGTLQQLISSGVQGRISNDTYASGVNGSIFQGRRAEGTPDAPTAAQSGMVLAGINGDGYGTSSFTGSGLGSLTIRAEENFTNTSKATNLQFTTTPTGSTTQLERMRIKANGSLQLFTYGAGFGKFDASGNLTSSTITSSDVTGLAPIATSGSAADLTTGSIPAARYAATTIPVGAINATGTASSTTYLRGDGQWQTIIGGSGETNTASNTGTVGTGLFKQKTLFDLEFYKINPLNNKVSIALNGTDRVDIGVNEANFTGIPQSAVTNLTADLSNKQATLVSGTNIKTVNGSSILGSGDLSVSAGAGGSTTQIQYNNAGSLAGATNVEIENNHLRLENAATPTTPATGGINVYSRNIAGVPVLSTIDEAGEIQHYQSSISYKTVKGWFPASGTTINLLGTTVTSVGTISHSTPATTNQKTQATRFTNTSAATAGALSSNRPGLLECVRGNAANIGGFKTVVRFSLTTLQAGMRMFAGVSTTATTAPANVDPTTTTTDGKIGMAINTNTGNWNLIHNTATSAPTVIALGANFPVDNTTVYELTLSCQPNASSVGYRVKNLTTNNVSEGTITTNLPANTAYMGRLIWATNNATAAAIAYDVNKFTLETNY